MKSILALCAFMFSTTSAFADFIDCRRDDASIAGGAAASARVGDHDIVKSWMPTQIWIDDEKNEYGTSYHEASDLSLRENWNGYKLYARTNRTNPPNVAYALSLKRNQGYALVSMEATGFKTMGPMRYNCAYVAQ